ncbi:MAG TPA: glycosyltransferase family 4 protein [Terracidiphilus sp.]|jgi:glycosyltransferase involved in cell wall biosynthesis
MNVSVFTIGRFHHFDLGRQVLRLGHRLSVFTSNPRSHVDPELRPFAKTHARFRVPFAIGGRLGFGPKLYWLDELLLKDLGRWLERAVDVQWTDVMHGLDGVGPEAGRRMKQNGKLWICDRGSSHILAQREILLEEHKNWQVPPPRFSADRLERCVTEYEEAHAITVPSQFARRSFLDRGIPDQRVFVCPYGVDLSEFKPAKKRDDIFRVIHVGQINVRKGIGHLLQAVAPLVRKQKCELWLAGEIDPSVQQLLNQHKGIFEYKGVIQRKELWRLYSQASVLVLASVEEGLALVQAQAMACGVPVIATANTGAEDLFTDGVEGFIIPIRSPETIREKIEWMMDSGELCERMGMAALERVKSIGGWNLYGERVESVYQSLAIRHGVELHD